MKDGYFKVWRQLFEKPIWLNSTSNQRSILMAILYLANWQECNWVWCGEPYQCLPGEFITSHEKLRQTAGKGITIDHVRTALNTFQKQGYITIKSPKNKRGGIKVIINNWDKYQNDNNPNETRLNPITLPEQIPTIEEIKNKRNNNIYIVEKTKNTKFIKPTIEEIQKYCEERQNNINAQYFYDYYSSNGWKVGKNPMKDWKAAVRTWERNNFNQSNKKEEINDNYAWNPNL